MKETRFIEQNKEKWEDFEHLLKKKKKDPDKMSDLFVEITDDLSFARTYYPNRLVRAYLNSISQKLYLNLYKNRKQKFDKLLFFWQEELPFVLYQCRKELTIALLVFGFATFIGALSCINDPDYAAVVTSHYYVQMTDQNIENGDPMAVYKDEDPFSMFLRIAWNNLRVAFYCFALGLTAGVGTIFYMLMNGTMLGGFQAYFYNKGPSIFMESLLTIWQHGTIEILCIVIAGGAGLVVAKGLVFPGTLPRMQSLQMSAQKGIKIMLAITPFIILAALIEGYITRMTEAPLVFRLLVIFLSLAVMLGYFVYYPYRKYVAGFHASLKYEKPLETPTERLSFTTIKSAGDVFAEVFKIFAKNFTKFLPIAFVMGLLFGTMHVFYYQEELFFWDYQDFWDVLGAILEYLFLSFFSFFNYSERPFVALLNILMMGSLFAVSAYVIKNQVFESAKKVSFKEKAKYFVGGLLIASLLNVVFLLPQGFSYLAFIIAIPFLAMMMAALFTQKEKNGNAFSEGFSVLISRIASVLLLWIMLSFMGLFFMLISNTSLAGLLTDFVSTNFVMTGDAIARFYTFMTAFISIFTFCLVFPLLILGFMIQFHSNKEAKTAQDLSQRIQNLFSVEK